MYTKDDICIQKIKLLVEHVLGDKRRPGRAKKQNGGAQELSSPTNATEWKMSTILKVHRADILCTCHGCMGGWHPDRHEFFVDLIARIEKKCPQCGHDVCCKIDGGSKQGFAHRICIDCDACEMTVDHVYSSCKTEDTRASKHDVNVRMYMYE